MIVEEGGDTNDSVRFYDHRCMRKEDALFGRVWTISVYIELLCSRSTRLTQWSDAPRGSWRNHSDPVLHHSVSLRVALRDCQVVASADFYQLTILHRLSRSRVGDPSDRSHPPPMPATMQPRKPDATRSVLNPTPMSCGASILHKLRHATEQPPKHDDEYILGDFDYHRVFVDVDVFMKHILHVPENWRELWGRTITRIKHDETFLVSYWDYRRECAIQGAEESRFYRPLVDMANTVLEFSTEDSLDEPVKLRTPQRHLREDPKKVHPEGSNLTWAQSLEVESSDDALDDGSRIPRLKVNGERATTSRDRFL